MIAVLALMFLNMLVFNPAFHWSFVLEAMNQTPVISGFWKGTILVTILSMVVGVALGVVLAVMRLSDNPVLRGVSWLYTWFFRAIPRYVLLTIMGALGILFTAGISIGVPFDWKIIGWLADWQTGGSRPSTQQASFVGLAGGVIGLAASEARMAEIARAGIQRRQGADGGGQGWARAAQRCVNQSCRRRCE